MLKECLGWIATAAFAASYLCRSQGTLRAVQAMAATLWIAYGFAVGALPVIASNTAVAFMAVVYPFIRQAAAQRVAGPVAFDSSEQELKAPPYEELPEII